MFCVVLQFSAQQKEYWLIDSQTKSTRVVQDSLAATQVLDSLVAAGYFFTRLKQVSQDSLAVKIIYDKGKNYNQAYVQLDDSLAQAMQIEPEFFTSNLDSLKQKINAHYVAQGFTFNRVQTRYLKLKEGFPVVSLEVLPIEKRLIDGFVVKGYAKLPKRFMKNLEREFVGKAYQKKHIQKIIKTVQNHPFIGQKRTPQTLFTRDSTKVYLYLEKKKSSTFDGVIGFGNSETEKFQLNGTLNVALRNLFNGFEEIALYWQRAPSSGQTFRLQADIPYVLASNVGFKGSVDIYRQDTLYANVKLQPSLYYNFSLRQKIGVQANFEISSVLSESYLGGKDYHKNGIALWYEYTIPAEVALFIQKTRLRLAGGFMRVKYAEDQEKVNQGRYYIYIENNFHLGGRHFIQVKGESEMISARSPLIQNELLRFGGWNSMRGFNERSLLADFYAYAGGEYRYLAGEQAFFDAFVQVGTLENSFSEIKTQLYSFGIGFNYQLPFGIMSFQISNGNPFGQELRFKNTKVHWGLVARF